MQEKSILIVHPYDKTTSFLSRIRNHLSHQFKSSVHYFSIKPNEISHSDCLERIKNHNPKGLIIFLGHGRSDKLYGAKGDLYAYTETASRDAIIEVPDKFYFNDEFINEGNIDIFKNKKVFCLACNSNSKISTLAINKGATSFFGFGDIPTSNEEFKKMGEIVSGDVVRMMKTELNYIVKMALAYGISQKVTFKHLLSIISFITEQRMTDLLIRNKKFKEKHILANHLYYFKSEAQVSGNGNIKLVD